MRFSSDDLRHIGIILARAAQAEIMPLFRRLTAAQIRQKTSAFDVVTHADYAAEALITRQLLAAFPGAIVIGEEATHSNPALLEKIATAELAFIVDPIDGTKNFASGLPLFGVMAAVTSRGQVLAGVIHDPLRGDFAYALRDAGAWLEHADGGRVDMHVAAPVPVKQMEGIVGTTFLPEPLRTQVNSRLSRLAHTTWLRCSAHEYRTIAAGHCHILFYNKLMPWDHAAGWLLHREAGGYCAHFDGTPYLPTHFSGGLIYAPDETSWRAVRAALLE